MSDTTRNRWSFDDMHIGVARADNRCLQTRVIPRPPGFATNAKWYEYAKHVCDQLTAAFTRTCAPAANDAQERANFEEWAQEQLLPAGKDHPFLQRTSAGEYTHDWASSRWEAWLARAKQVMGPECAAGDVRPAFQSLFTREQRGAAYKASAAAGHPAQITGPGSAAPAEEAGCDLCRHPLFAARAGYTLLNRTQEDEMAQHWIHHCTSAESPTFAAQIIGEGYIPWAPHGGLHTMDDFGGLMETLPQNHYRETPGTDDLHWGYQRDQQYRGH